MDSFQDTQRKYDLARAVVQEFVDKQEHERCWYYPELFDRLTKIFGIAPTRNPELPSREEFERGCSRYQAEQYGVK